MTTPVCIVAQSNIVDHAKYNLLDSNHLDLFKSQVFPRMVRHDGKFLSHLDYINIKENGASYLESSFSERRRLLNIWNLPSMSGIHLQNILSDLGFEVLVINNYDSERDLFESWLATNTTAPVIVSTTFYLSWKEIQRITLDIPQTNPVIAGGAFINSYCSSHHLTEVESQLHKSRINYALTSFNSEPDLLSLLSAISNEQQQLSEVPNLIYYRDNCWHHTSQQWNAPVVDEVKPIWHKLSIPSLVSTLQIRTASGCPFSCAFCSYPTTAKVWETSDADHVRQHLDSLSKIPGLKSLIFIDDTFNVPVDRFKKLLAIFKEYDFEWYSFLRVQFIDEETVTLMKESGCQGVYLGIESLNDNILKNMNKQARQRDFKRGIELLNRFDIDYVAAFVLGFPGETLDTVKELCHLIDSYGIKYYALKEFYYMENTKVHAQRELYKLEGIGSSWRHSTMSYAEATDLKLRIFLTVKNAVHIDPDTSLWHIAHMRDMGYSRAEILKWQLEINSHIKQDLLSNTSSRPFNLSGVASLTA